MLVHQNMLVVYVQSVLCSENCADTARFAIKFAISSIGHKLQHVLVMATE